MRRDFLNKGFSVADFSEKADMYVINTCSVTLDANAACRKTVRKALKNNPEAFVAVVGCYAQLEPEEIAEIDGVDVVLDAKHKFHLLDLFDDFIKQEKTIVYSSDVNEAVDFHNAFSSDDRTRAFLKIQDGCNYKCSFCTIPLARGKSRSPRIETVVRNAHLLVEEGFKEIIITGVNAGDFGHGTDEDFFKLLQALDDVDGLERLRVSSIEPNLLHEEIIAFAADSRTIQPHFHIPLQSGSDEILKIMKRRYRSDLYQKRVELIRKLMPHAAIGVDVITGHPGESEALFQDSFDFINSLDVSYLHVFTYSERPNTHALSIKPIVPNRDRKERTHKLRKLSAKKRYDFNNSFIGDSRTILFEEEEKNGLIHGWSDNYIRVATPYSPRLSNQLIEVTLTQQDSKSVFECELPEHFLIQEETISSLIG